MVFKMEFRTNSAAFNENPTEEMSRILWQLTGLVVTGGSKGVIRDINGTVICEYEIGDE